MGICKRPQKIRDAAGGHPVDSGIARFAGLKFLRDASGNTAIEYALIVAGIALVIIAAMQSVGTTLAAFFNSISF
jgi:pilus assembly protein Flp/PilA